MQAYTVLSLDSYRMHGPPMPWASAPQRYAELKVSHRESVSER